VSTPQPWQVVVTDHEFLWPDWVFGNASSGWRYAQDGHQDYQCRFGTCEHYQSEHQKPGAPLPPFTQDWSGKGFLARLRQGREILSVRIEKVTETVDSTPIGMWVTRLDDGTQSYVPWSSIDEVMGP
jgi:hypothetical protein